MAASGTTGFAPPLSDLITEAYARIGIFGPALQTIHIVEARRSMNLLLNDWSANRGGPLLAQVDLVQLAMYPGITAYDMPADTIQVLDVYIRTFQPNTVYTTVGNALTPVVQFDGTPVVSAYGDPAVALPGSQTFSCTQGSQVATMTWPAHGRNVGDPLIFNGVVSIGGVAVNGFGVVNTVVDSNTLTFLLITPALYTATGVGAPPLFVTTNASTTVNVVYPNHGQTVGATFNVPISTTGGGVTLDGNYTVTAVTNSYEFTITAAATATSTASFFQNNGQFQVTSQAAGVDIIDIILGPLSRSDYAALPDKETQSRPTSFWYDRLQQPSIYIWPVPPPVSQSAFYGVAVYRMRQIQDAVPINGQTPDMPNRYLFAFSAGLTALLAEKFRPELFQQKMLLAEAAWNRCATEDTEHVPTFILPGLEGYYR